MNTPLYHINSIQVVRTVDTKGGAPDLEQGRVKVLQGLLRGAQGPVNAFEPHSQLPLRVVQWLVQASHRVQLALNLFFSIAKVQRSNARRPNNGLRFCP